MPFVCFKCNQIHWLFETQTLQPKVLWLCWNIRNNYWNAFQYLNARWEGTIQTFALQSWTWFGRYVFILRYLSTTLFYYTHQLLYIIMLCILLLIIVSLHNQPLQLMLILFREPLYTSFTYAFMRPSLEQHFRFFRKSAPPPFLTPLPWPLRSLTPLSPFLNFLNPVPLWHAYFVPSNHCLIRLSDIAHFISLRGHMVEACVFSPWWPEFLHIVQRLAG